MKNLLRYTGFLSIISSLLLIFPSIVNAFCVYNQTKHTINVVDASVAFTNFDQTIPAGGKECCDPESRGCTGSIWNEVYLKVINNNAPLLAESVACSIRQNVKGKGHFFLVQQAQDNYPAPAWCRIIHQQD